MNDQPRDRDRQNQVLTLEMLQSIRFRLGCLLALVLLAIVGPFIGLMLDLGGVLATLPQ